MDQVFSFHKSARVVSLNDTFAHPTIANIGDAKPFLMESPYGFLIINSETTPEVALSMEKLLSLHKNIEKKKYCIEWIYINIRQDTGIYKFNCRRRSF